MSLDTYVRQQDLPMIMRELARISSEAMKKVDEYISQSGARIDRCTHHRT